MLPNPPPICPSVPPEQLLGFLEVVRREGPRERGFLQMGNPTGSDTLATLVEGLRFVMCASPATLAAWGNEDGLRDHPGARHRNPYVPRKGKRRAMVEADCEVSGRVCGCVGVVVGVFNKGCGVG